MLEASPGNSPPRSISATIPELNSNTSMALFSAMTGWAQADTISVHEIDLDRRRAQAAGGGPRLPGRRASGSLRDPARAGAPDGRPAGVAGPLPRGRLCRATLAAGAGRRRAP